MSAKPDARGTEATIARSGKRKWGYDTKQVDAFLERAHSLYESQDPDLTQEEIANASFDLCKNGYIITQVDAALSRLERVISDRQTSLEIARVGVDGWTTRMVSLQSELTAHAGRPSGSVFKRGDAGMPSYDCRQVERLIEQVLNKTSDQLNLQEGRKTDSGKSKNTDITADRVSNVIFTQRRGSKGYDERQVDFFLAKAVELLEQLESFARVSEKAKRASESSTAPAAVPAQPQLPVQDSSASGVQPLIGQSQAPAWSTPDASALANDQGSQDDFAQLHQAERAIFEAPAASTKTTSTTPTAQPNSSLSALASAVNQRLAQEGAGAALGAGATAVGATRVDTPSSAAAAAAPASSSARSASSSGFSGGSAVAPANPAVSGQQESVMPASAPPAAIDPVSAPARTTPAAPASVAQSVPFNSAAPSSSSSPALQTPEPTVFQQTQSAPVTSAPSTSAGTAFVPSARPESPASASTGADAATSSTPGAASVISSPFVDGHLGAGGPLGSYEEPAPAAPETRERPWAETAGSSTDTPDWAKPRYSQNTHGNRQDQDPDSYLASLLNQDLPKMDLDIPDISFPAFGDEGEQDKGGR
ncbi:DivIVA domain-containing protein [Bifidobacterium polysaccharolyticum]|uniref:DivIVA domain-containing protein n=1 Tax=Bifidobacterium polysaccharolyticum TaxID=2750967 RepID=A0ABS0QTR0_9BIFI|nr:DivIVA domain-containing protein [Bifidobacterium polysaccharolyticum]MBI0105151.1 DivIVA domain-containing protein [Bifidobacterium polysaccharolyticum]